MSNVFFWIIILSFLIPFAMRMYRKSVRGRNQNQDFNGQYPGQFPGQFPNQFPGQQPGRPNNQPRDGYTQQDYFGGGFRQLGGGQQPPLDQPYQNPGYPAPGFQNPGHPAPGGPGQVPYEDSPEYPANQSRQQPQQPSAPVTPPPPSAPQGFRARKLAELDQQYSNGEIAMEEYMTRRDEIMKG
ncbi:hypothetical protein ASF98_18275 [Arthrobacter sp. Leaf337]|uniref:hypothetical protein n=1 Tax=Arthrobacter sp. Leaf337 TaxID=1736342 RepID=UPI0006FA6F95|nr:hypothetical protein [Arthrobacter sp. Leaf337]KQR80744.1 hypothetical protein ASF98_18275 [Arthrobacter sp. Leaf337]